MAKIAGITTKKNTKGQVTPVTIDVKKHKDKIPMLTEIGVLPKTDFQNQWDDAMSVDEFRERIHTFINNLPWKN